MTGVAVEPAEAADLDRLAALWVALVDDQRGHGTHLLGEPNRAAAREVLSQYVVADDVLVARDDGVVGFVMFHVETGLYEQDATRGVVDNVYVVPAARGAGVGSALLSAAEARLGERGVGVVALSVMAGNDDARRFYERHGYRPHRLTLEKPAESDTHTRDDG